MCDKRRSTSDSCAKPVRETGSKVKVYIVAVPSKLGVIRSHFPCGKYDPIAFVKSASGIDVGSLKVKYNVGVIEVYLGLRIPYKGRQLGPRNFRVRSCDLPHYGVLIVLVC